MTELKVKCQCCGHFQRVNDIEALKKQIRTDVIDEIIEYYKPCNDCGACLEYDRDYFKKKCEMDMQISYTELVADLEQLKEQSNEND